MLCRRCKRPLANRRSIKRKFGPRCWVHEREELAAAAEGDLFAGWQAWDEYRKRKRPILRA
jgi:hypothetical protein